MFQITERYVCFFSIMKIISNEIFTFEFRYDQLVPVVESMDSIESINIRCLSTSHPGFRVLVLFNGKPIPLSKQRLCKCKFILCCNYPSLQSGKIFFLPVLRVKEIWKLSLPSNFLLQSLSLFQFIFQSTFNLNSYPQQYISRKNNNNSEIQIQVTVSWRNII